MDKELLEELKEAKYQLDQYRLLTNKLINQNVSQYNIDKFVEKEYIKTTYKNIYDYDYDLYNWLSPDLLEDVSNELIRLETQLKKQKEIIDKAIKYIKEYASYINYLSIDKHKEIGHLEQRNVRELLQILEDKEV